MMQELDIKKGRLIKNEILDSEGANLLYTSFLLKEKKWVSLDSLKEWLLSDEWVSKDELLEELNKKRG